MTVATEPGITVAGRTFRPVTSLRFPQYNWVTTAIRCVDRAGVKNTADLMSRVAASGQSETILAGLMVEEGQKWTNEMAGQWAEFFRTIEAPLECDALQAILQTVILSFFPGVVGSSGSSATSSDSTSTTPATTSAPQRNETPMTLSESSDLPPAA